MVERVKQLKKQKVAHEGDALLGTQDFIGFAKTAQGGKAADRMLMEYDYVVEEADQLRKELIQGKVTDENEQPALDSEELEAMEEEDKLVQSMVKKGTMQKLQEESQLGGAHAEVSAVYGEEKKQDVTAYEKTKQYRMMQQAFFGKNHTNVDLTERINELEEKSKKDVERHEEIDTQLT